MTRFTTEDDGIKGRITLFEEDKPAGNIYLTWAGKDKFIIDHTEVDEAFEGNGYGKLLVMEAVAFAREKKVKIIPLCPYAKSVFEREKTIQDLLF